MPADEAVALFARRASAVGPSPGAGAPDGAAVRTLVGVLDGLPLAIELAASRARVMSPQAMLARMNERFSVLLSRGGRHDRQSTLRAAFDWSWELLHDAEKAALAQLSVFVGGFSLESAEAVIVPPAGAVEAPQAIDLVHDLVDKSLVCRIGDDRFDFLQSVRAYAAEHLRTEGRYPGSGSAAAAAAARRHAGYFASLEPGRAIAGACVELENLAAACRYAVAVGDGELASNALRAASAAFRLRGPFRELVALAETVRAMPGLAGRARVEVELDTASAHLLCGGHAQEQPLYEAAAEGARRLGLRSAEVRALNGLATLAARAGEVDAAAGLFEGALAALDDSAGTDLRCTVLNAHAEFEGLRGHGETERRHYEQALRIARDGGARRWEGGSAGNLGTWHANQGHAAEARELYGVAITIARELGDRQWEANARCNLGLLLFEQGELADARRELDAADEAARELGHARLVAVVRCNLGLLAEAQGEPATAETHHRAALGVARELGDRRSEGQVLGYLGLLEAQRAAFAVALFRTRDGMDAPTLEEVRAHLAAVGLARQKWPESIRQVTEFPRTPSGKIQKFQLRKQLRDSFNER